jgi:hypothetical protein
VVLSKDLRAQKALLVIVAQIWASVDRPWITAVMDASPTLGFVVV